MSFQEIIAGKFDEEPFDAIVSSLAIHHLTGEEKASLFRALVPKLRPGGPFLNADVVLPDHQTYLEWYYSLWKEWLLESEAISGATQSFTAIPERARKNPENHFDSLSSQMRALQAAGFGDVECHYRYGMFAVYSGRVF